MQCAVFGAYARAGSVKRSAWRCAGCVHTPGRVSMCGCQAAVSVGHAGATTTSPGCQQQHQQASKFSAAAPSNKLPASKTNLGEPRAAPT